MFEKFLSLLKSAKNYQFVIYLILVIIILIFPEAGIVFKIDVFDLPLNRLFSYNWGSHEPIRVESDCSQLATA